MTQITAYLYLILAMAEVWAEFSNNETLRYITKPLLMIILLTHYALCAAKPLSKMDKMMIGAFAFSWVGDVALMFVGFNENFFLLGLVGFLITHLLYAYSFSMVKNRSVVPLLKRKPWILIPLFAYFAALMTAVFPVVPADMKIPVAVYSSVIAIMVVSAVNRHRRVNYKSYALVLGGALLFMFSDSLIALNKFMCHSEMPLAGVVIMVLYIAGQYLIARGMLKNNI